MKRYRWWSFACLAALLVLAGCSGGGTAPPPPPVGSSSVSVTMTDTPPAGVTILSFEVSVTGAALNPGNVDLLGGKTPRIEVKQLETESAFLNTANVAAGTYTSLNLTFANAELTFKNDTGAVLAGCAVGAVCEIRPTGTLTSTFTLPSPGLVISANSPTGLQIDVNPNTILSATLGVDFSLAGAVSVLQLPLPGMPTGQLEELEDLTGTVQNRDTTNKKFTLHTLSGDFPITTDNNTQFEDFDACTPTPNVFACLVDGQVVEVDAKIMTGGVFLAEKVELEDQQIDDELEGIVFKIDDATHFEMVVLEELRDVANVANGNPLVVTLSNPNFRVDNDGLTVPTGLQNAFEGATDSAQLLPGQFVQIRLTGPVSGSAGPPSTLAATTDRVRLRRSQFTATVSSVASPNFDVNGLPSLFTDNGISTIHVQTITGQTDFEGGITGVSGLATGNTVSLRGLLFKNGANPPELIAKKVRKR